MTKGAMLAWIEKAGAATTQIHQPAAGVQMRAPSPADDAAREERVKMTRLRQTIARRLKEVQNTAAMLTTFNEVDMSHIMAMRAQYRTCSRRSTARSLDLWASSPRPWCGG